MRALSKPLAPEARNTCLNASPPDKPKRGINVRRSEGRATGPLPFAPGNVHRGPDGRLLAAGMKLNEPACPLATDFATFSACPRGFIAMAIDPVTMKETLLAEGPANPAFSNATMVLAVGTQFWIGTFSGDRVGHGTLR